MAFPFIRAEERLKRKRTLKVGVVGVPGIGKTTLIRTLPADRTLHIEIEDGDLSVIDAGGDAFRPATWPQFRNLVTLLAGPSATAAAGEAYSEEKYRVLCDDQGDMTLIDRYEYVFIDSLSALSRLCFAWCKTQPQAFSEKTGKPDTRGAYGLLANEMVNAITILQHMQNRHVIYTVILNEKVGEKNERSYELQMEGSKTTAEFLGVVDIIATMSMQPSPTGAKRVLITKQDNVLGLPAKDRSGRLDPAEEPHLGNLIAKCLGQATN